MISKIVIFCVIAAMAIVLFIVIKKIIDSVDEAEKEIESRRQNR